MSNRTFIVWSSLLLSVVGTATQALAQPATVDFHDLGNVSTARFQQSSLAADPELNPPLLNFVQFNGMGVVGGTLDSAVDVGEAVLFSFDQPATAVSYYVQFAQNTDGDSLFGESEVEGYGVDGEWLGTVEINGVGTRDISGAFGGQPLTALRVRPRERVRIYSLGYNSVQLPTTPQGLSGRAKSYKVDLTWQASTAVTVYRVFRKVAGEAAFSDVGTTAQTVFVDNLPAGSASADYYVVAENGIGASLPSATITVTPRLR